MLLSRKTEHYSDVVQFSYIEYTHCVCIAGYIDSLRSNSLLLKSETKGIRDSGSKEDEADTVYLLAKELAYDVVTGQTDNLAAALAKTSGKDIVQFAKAVGVSHPTIDGKVCRTKSGGSNKTQGIGKYGLAENTGSDDNHRITNCGVMGPTCGGTLLTSVETLRNFSEAALGGDGRKNWPTSSKTSTKPNDNAKAVAKDLVQELTPEEKTIVAGLLAKTIEGGEVVEIRAVSSTSVMVNAEFEIIRLFRRESEF
ncbi:P44-new outer membrane protein [Anaplasma phagocytophilum str. CRT38]|uniref:p44-new outer membrane protein n=1 Tax=Anaplasma phagocytophilum str. CRT38 TaxID=1269275 RepID=S6GAV0_ANAPH|nr:P44-new outer membrane protein [Anaplasma phagocytophilum str. CRT38]